MNRVDHKPVDGSTKTQRPGADQEGDDVKKERQVGGNVEAVVEREHQQVTGQDGDVVPHEVLLENGRRAGARLLEHPAQPGDHLAGDQLGVGSCESDCRVCHYLCLGRVRATGDGPVEIAIQYRKKSIFTIQYF